MRPYWLICLAPFVMGACRQGPETTLERIREDGFVRAAYSSEPPYAFTDSAGVVRGESPEALRAVVDALRLGEVRWVRVDFPNLIPTLLDGRVDVIAAGMFRTPEREAVVRFSVPTVCPPPALVVMRESEHRSIQHVAGSADRLAVLGGSVEERAALEIGMARERVVPVPDVTTGIAAVREGFVGALAVTRPTAQAAAAESLGTALEARIYAPPPGVAGLLGACSALAFRRDDAALLDSANLALSSYLGSASHLAVLETLGFTAADLPRSDE